IIVGSFVPDGTRAGEWVTLIALLHWRSLLRRIESKYGAPMPRVLYCSVDPQQYRLQAQKDRWDIGYLGTYSDDRQPGLDRLLLQPADQWAVCSSWSYVSQVDPLARKRGSQSSPLAKGSAASPSRCRWSIPLSTVSKDSLSTSPVPR